MFIYDKDKGKWLLNGVLREGHPYAAVGNGYQVARQEYLEEVQNNDTTVREFANNAHYVFKTVEDGKGTISQNGRKPKEVGLYKSTLLEKARDQNGGYIPKLWWTESLVSCVT